MGASWRGRWDSFHLNTPNRINLLPDADVVGEPTAFLPRDRWVAELEAYQRKHGSRA